MSQDNTREINLINASADALLARSKADQAACEAAEKRQIELQRQDARKQIDDARKSGTVTAVGVAG